jgi:hypothetical protein
MVWIWDMWTESIRCCLIHSIHISSVLSLMFMFSQVVHTTLGAARVGQAFGIQWLLWFSNVHLWSQLIQNSEFRTVRLFICCLARNQEWRQVIHYIGQSKWKQLCCYRFFVDNNLMWQNCPQKHRFQNPCPTKSRPSKQLCAVELWMLEKEDSSNTTSPRWPDPPSLYSQTFTFLECTDHDLDSGQSDSAHVCWGRTKNGWSQLLFHAWMRRLRVMTLSQFQWRANTDHQRSD